MLQFAYKMTHALIHTRGVGPAFYKSQHHRSFYRSSLVVLQAAARKKRKNPHGSTDESGHGGGGATPARETIEGLPFSSSYHTPVMVNEVCEALVTDPNGVYVDCTLGGGGHSNALLERFLGSEGSVLGLDRDPEALLTARKRLREHVQSGRFRTARCDFRHLFGV